MTNIYLNLTYALFQRINVFGSGEWSNWYARMIPMYTI